MRKLLRNKEKKDLYNLFDKEKIQNKRIESYKDVEGELIFIEGEPMLYKFNKNWIYTINCLYKGLNLNTYKSITIDKGAIRFISNGADVMRPGITHIEENIEKNEIIIIKEETHNKILAIGSSLYNTNELKETKTGKVIKNILYVGDNIWKLKIF